MKTIKHKNIQPKTRTHQGRVYEGKNTQGEFNADVDPKIAIRIFGIFINRVAPIHFDQTFRIGDEVEHGSYNLVYTGKIMAIGPKTVTVNDFGKSVRMDLYDFINRNFDFDLEKVRKQNADTMMCI